MPATASLYQPTPIHRPVAVLSSKPAPRATMPLPGTISYSRTPTTISYSRTAIPASSVLTRSVTTAATATRAQPTKGRPLAPTTTPATTTTTNGISRRASTAAVTVPSPPAPRSVTSSVASSAAAPSLTSSAATAKTATTANSNAGNKAATATAAAAREQDASGALKAGNDSAAAASAAAGLSARGGIDLIDLMTDRLSLAVDPLPLDRSIARQAQTSGELNAKQRELAELQALAQRRLKSARATMNDGIKAATEVRRDLDWTQRKVTALNAKAAAKHPAAYKKASARYPRLSDD